MKVAVVGPLELPKAQGGVTRHCEEVYARLAADGHEVTVLCAGGPKPDVVYRGMKVRSFKAARINPVKERAISNFPQTLDRYVKEQG